MQNCYAICDVKDTGDAVGSGVGALAGSSSGAKDHIYSSGAVCKVSGVRNVGGLVGKSAVNIASLSFFSPYVSEDDEVVANPGLAETFRSWDLAADIDLSTYLAQGGAGYDKCGEKGCLPVHLSNNFDGAGHKVTGFWIARPKESNIGLFNDIVFGTVACLGVETSAMGIEGKTGAGCLAGEISGGKVNQCFVAGKIKGETIVGAFAGFITDKASVEDSYARAEVTGKFQTGGFAGTINSKSTIPASIPPAF